MATQEPLLDFIAHWPGVPCQPWDKHSDLCARYALEVLQLWERTSPKHFMVSLGINDSRQESSDYHSGATWAAVGQTPVVKSSGGRFSLNRVSAIRAKGSLRFMVVEGG